MWLSCGIKNTSGQFYLKSENRFGNKKLKPIFVPVRKFRNN